MTRVGIIGATGYGGAELFRLLFAHPDVEIEAISSVSFTGKKLSDVYPGFFGPGDMILTGQDEVLEKCDVIFASLPHGLSQDLAFETRRKDKIFIDLGADFRLENPDEYEKWYESEYRYDEIHKEAVYGLPELNRERIKNTKTLANPGCYPTSAALGIYPLLKEKIINLKGIVIDAKSGVTGAGRSPTPGTHFPECNESFAPYKIASHRHTPEIEQTLSQMAGAEAAVTFVPHLLPLNRGIVSTIYTERLTDISLEKIHELYKKTYENEPFVRVRGLGEVANLKNVRLSNYCDISLHEDKRAGRIIAVSAIDNMVKGAAGQAIQNMNIMLGIDERKGLLSLPPAF